MSITIDPHASVSPKAKLGEDVVIGPFAIVEDDVVIGDRCKVYGHAIIHSGSRLGADNVIFPNASVGGAPQDLKYRGEPTLLEMGDKNTVRECVTLNRGTIESGKTVIGDHSLFMAYAHVGHDCRVGSNVIMANCCALGGHVQVGDWVILGGLTPVHQFCNIGVHAMIGGGFRVVKDVPPYIMAGQEPLVYEGLNKIGLRRRGFTPEAIENIERAYTLIYRSNLNVSQGIAKIKETMNILPEVQQIIDFVLSSKRGILSGRQTRT
jgi:UDP-N-acetylglucosamine acyltransferase